MIIVTPDTPRPEIPTGPTLLFDGVCNLCNAAVRWVIARDRRAQFRFASLQSRAAREAMARMRDGPAGSPTPLPDSMVLLDETGVHVRSDAAIRVARRLGLPWSLLAIARVLPRGVRDALYDWIARNRYRWFGKRDNCMVPASELRARFLDADEPR
jgi:predicted DCC family thiol-disulfide oxidoreductase YuxK